MSPELDRKLCERYPKLFVDRHADESLTAMYRGFECGDGWYPLIDALCDALQRETEYINSPQVVAVQVKEKLGRLRFRVRQASDRSQVSERQKGMIDVAETLSERICEICGAMARVNRQAVMWADARCELHESGDLPMPDG